MIVLSAGGAIDDRERVRTRRPEILHEFEHLLARDVLVTEEQDAAVEDRCADRLDRRLVERLAEIDPFDDGAYRPRQRRQVKRRHGSVHRASS
jgi:hypothetical protein